MATATDRLLNDVWQPSRGAVRDVFPDFKSLSLDITIAALLGEHGRDAMSAQVCCCDLFVRCACSEAWICHGMELGCHIALC